MDRTAEISPKFPKFDAEDQNRPPSSPTKQNNLKSRNPVSSSGRLIVPKAFKYPERYNSPTDKMMSPVSRGILARRPKGRNLLPPSVNLPKIQPLQLEELAAFPQSDKC